MKEYQGDKNFTNKHEWMNELLTTLTFMSLRMWKYDQLQSYYMGNNGCILGKTDDEPHNSSWSLTNSYHLPLSVSVLNIQPNDVIRYIMLIKLFINSEKDKRILVKSKSLLLMQSGSIYTSVCEIYYQGWSIIISTTTIITITIKI